MNLEEKLKRIHTLNEDSLVKNVLMPMFKLMGFKNVTCYHGSLEIGKDLIFYEEDPFGCRIYSIVQLENIDITKGNASDLIERIKKAFFIPFIDVYDNQEKCPNKCIIITSKNITSRALNFMKVQLSENNLDKLVTFIDGKKLIHLIDKYLPTYFWEEYEHFNVYFRSMQSEFETIADISAIGQKEPVPLDKIYVSLRVKEEARVRKDYELTERKGAIMMIEEGKAKISDTIEKDRIPLKEQILEADKVLEEGDKAVIVGAPGSGKTTLLKHFALKTAKENMDKLERECVPIYITLRDLADSGKSLRDYINVVFDKFNFKEAKKFVEIDLKAGKCLLLLDGFDELASLEKQKNVTDLIYEFLGDYPRARAIVTSRIAGYHDELGNFTKLEVMEFTNDQIEEFIDNWFKGTKEEHKAEPMKKAVMEHESITRIARNPLMIAIIAVIFEEDKKLPEQRVELYKRCVEVLLSRWDVHKRIKNKFDSIAKEQVLRKVALHFHLKKQRQFEKGEMLPLIENELPRLNLKRDAADKMLSEIVERNALLKEIGIGLYDFLHLSFQEYFTAVELRECRDYDTLLCNNHFYDSWWEEPILLFAGIDRNATELIKEVKKREKKDKNLKEDLFYSNLMMMGKCIADADYTDGKLKREIIDKLCDLYWHGEFQPSRNAALRILARVKNDYVVGKFIEKLKDKDSRVRRNAAYALGEMGSEKAVDSLIKLLKDKSRDVRVNAASALGRIGSEKPLDALIKLVGDKDWWVGFKASYALNEIGSEKVVDALIKLMKNKDSNVQGNAAYALGRTSSEKAVDALIKLMKNKDSNVQGNAAYALGEIGTGKAVNALIKLTKDKDSDVRMNAALALGRTSSEKAVDALIKLTKDKSSDVRSYVAHALGEIGFEKAVDALFKLTKDKSSGVRRSAASALGEIGSGKAVDALIKLTKDKSSYVRRNAAFALGEIGSGKAVDALIKLTKDKSSYVRSDAASALGEIGSEKSVATLIKLTRDKSSYVRSNAASALGEIGSEKAVDALIKLAKDKDSGVRSNAASALGESGSEKAIEPLQVALEDGERVEHMQYNWVKDFAYESLFKISREKGVRIYPQ